MIRRVFLEGLSEGCGVSVWGWGVMGVAEDQKPEVCSGAIRARPGAGWGAGKRRGGRAAYPEGMWR